MTDGTTPNATISDETSEADEGMLFINGSPTRQQVFAILRALVLLVATFALGREWIKNDIYQAIVGVFGIVGPIVAGQIAIVLHKRELVSAAQAKPGTVVITSAPAGV